MTPAVQTGYAWATTSRGHIRHLVRHHAADGIHALYGAAVCGYLPKGRSWWVAWPTIEHDAAECAACGHTSEIDELLVKGCEGA